MSSISPIPYLATALAKVQAKLPRLERDRTVQVEPKDPKKPAYSYSYATLANLSDAVLPLLAQNGLAFVTMPGVGSDGKMCIRYHLLHESGESLSGEFPISGEGGIQMIGGRITYARRYCLAAIVGVAADEDDDSRLAEGRPAQRVARQQPTRPATTARPPARSARRPQPDRPPLPNEASIPARGERPPVAPVITDAQAAQTMANAGFEVVDVIDTMEDPPEVMSGQNLADTCDITMPHDLRKAPPGGCPPNCPTRLAANSGDEQPVDAPAAGLMSDAQRRRMHIGFRDVGLTDREARLAFASKVIGRQIDTSSELTVGEASDVISALVDEGLQSVRAAGKTEGDQS